MHGSSTVDEFSFRMEQTMNPITQLARGLKLYWAGVAWLRTRPKYACLLCLPSLLGLLTAFAMFSVFWGFRQDVYSLVLFDAGDSTFWSIVYSIASLCRYSLCCVDSDSWIYSCVISSPIYDVVSAAVEQQKTGKVVEVSIMTSIKLIPEKLKKVVFILFISLVLLFTGRECFCYLHNSIPLGGIL